MSEWLLLKDEMNKCITYFIRMKTSDDWNI